MGLVSLIGPSIAFKVNPGTAQEKEYKLGQLSFGELAEFVLWYQYKEVEEQEKITADLPFDLRKDILKETHERCRLKKWHYKDLDGNEKTAPLSWETPEVQEASNTLEGIHHQIYLALKINHPEIKKKDVGQIVNLYSYEQLLTMVMQASGLNGEDNSDNLGEKIPNQ